jgi:hypothetical protein
VGDFIEIPEHGELAYKGRVYGPDDIEDFNRDCKVLTTDRRFFSPPYVKLVKVNPDAKKKEVVQPEPVAEKPEPDFEDSKEEVTEDAPVGDTEETDEEESDEAEKAPPKKKAPAKKKTTKAKK